jgi:hypothetical protein
MNLSFRSLQRVICVGSCVFQGWPGSPGSDGASPYRLERRSMLRTIVLDLPCGVNRSARVMRAARFGRSLSLLYEFASFVTALAFC